jgi:hypothetical protein
MNANPEDFAKIPAEILPDGCLGGQPLTGTGINERLGLRRWEKVTCRLHFRSSWLFPKMGTIVPSALDVQSLSNDVRTMVHSERSGQAHQILDVTEVIDCLLPEAATMVASAWTPVTIEAGRTCCLRRQAQPLAPCRRPNGCNCNQIAVGATAIECHTPGSDIVQAIGSATVAEGSPIGRGRK